MKCFNAITGKLNVKSGKKGIFAGSEREKNDEFFIRKKKREKKTIVIMILH